MNSTDISWTQKTWNPVTGCTKVSQGCKNCYALGIAERFRGGKGFPNGFDLTLRPEKMAEPLKLRKPAMIFVNSMSDMFHDDIPANYIQQVWGVMEQAPQHVFQILTKRAERMRRVCADLPTLANVWLGVSVEDRKVMGRIHHLLNTPAAVRFVSAEPLLDNWMADLADVVGQGSLDWVILGGESGPGARACDPEWIVNGLRSVRSIEAAPFVKQLGSHWARANRAKDSKGGDMAEWPESLRVQEFPTSSTRPLDALGGA